MKDITITIKAPITQHCCKCDYEESYSFGATAYNCPKCGEEGAINRGARPLKDKPIRATANYDSYDFLHPNEKQWHYSFYDVPDGNRYEFTVNEELDVDSPIDLAIELKNIFDGYIFSTSKEKANALVMLLDTEEERDRQEMLMASSKRAKLEHALYECIYRGGR